MFFEGSLPWRQIRAAKCNHRKLVGINFRSFQLSLLDLIAIYIPTSEANCTQYIVYCPALSFSRQNFVQQRRNENMHFGNLHVSISALLAVLFAVFYSLLLNLIKQFHKLQCSRYITSMFSAFLLPRSVLISFFFLSFSHSFLSFVSFLSSNLYQLCGIGKKSAYIL